MHPDLSQERIDFLESQVIPTFQNDGQFYNATQRYVDADNFDGFRSYYSNAQTRVLGSDLRGALGMYDRAYVCARLWAERGGSLDAIRLACSQAGLNASYLRAAKSVFEQMTKPVYDSKLCDPKFYDPKLSTAVAETGQSVLSTITDTTGGLSGIYTHAINNFPINKDEPTMNPTTANSATIPFETKHYVYGRLLETMQQNELIDAIKQIEAEIADLKAVKTKSTTIAAKVKELEEMLAKVVGVLDAR